MGTYDGEDERVGEVPVEGELDHVPPQPQELHGLGQTHKDVSAQSRNTNDTQQTSHVLKNQRQNLHLGELCSMNVFLLCTYTQCEASGSMQEKEKVQEEPADSGTVKQ